MAKKKSKATDLTPRERLVATHMHLIGGIDQHIIAGGYGVNSARVHEAIAAMRLAMNDPIGVVEAMEALKARAQSS